MFKDDRERKMAPIIGALLVIVVIVIGWEVTHLGRKPPPATTPNTTAPIAQGDTSTLKQGSTPGESAATEKVTSAESKSDANAPGKIFITVRPKVTSDPFRPPTWGKKAVRDQYSSALSVPESLPPASPLFGTMSGSGVNGSSSIDRPQWRLAGVLADQHSSLVIIEGQDGEHLLHPGQSFGKDLKIVSASIDGILIARGKKRYQVRIGEDLP